jgi:hypothetical protein
LSPGSPSVIYSRLSGQQIIAEAEFVAL